MSNALRKNKTLIKLIYEVQNETASTSQLQELSNLLRSDPEALKLYVFLMDMHAELVLEEEFLNPEKFNVICNQKTNQFTAIKQTPTPRKLPQYLLLMVCSLIPLALFAYLFYYPVQSVSHTKVAVIDEIDNSLLTKDKNKLFKNSPLQTGYKYQLKQGITRIKMDSGAVLILESPTTFEFLHQNGIRILEGSLTAEVKMDAIGFVVETPSQRVVDLGTRFGVHVLKDGSSETHVFHGKVICSTMQPDQKRNTKHLLETGQAIQIKGDGSAPVELITNEEKFLRALKFRAQIENLDGSIQYQQEMPSRLGAGDFTSNQFIRVFQESKNVILSEDVKVWKIPASGSTTDQPSVSQIIPQGTKVNVFLIHLDGPHQDAQGKPHPAVRLNGKIHFQFPVLGGFKKEADLYATDQIFGRSDVAYDNQKHKRSGRSADPGDKTVLSNDGRTLQLSWSQRGSGGIGRDQIRILVATEN